MAEERFATRSLHDFLAALGSEQPTPGGGGAAALAAASAAALIEMVCRFSQGRTRYERWENQIGTTVTAAAELREELLAVVDADAEAFAAVAAAYALPRGTPEERERRRASLNNALGGAAQPPLRVATACATLSALAFALVGRSNAQLVSDLGAAGALLEAALRIAAYNVEANTRLLKGDSRAASFQQQLDMLRAGSLAQLADLRVAVEQALGREAAP